MDYQPFPRTYLYKRIVLAKLFIDEHFAENIDLDNISDEASFSKFHFIRLFKSIYRKTPHQYLITVRIDNAMKLLRTNKSVSETCYAIGFERLSSFTMLFKLKVGILPSEYLLQQQQLKAQITKTPLSFIPHCFAENSGWTKK